MQEKCKGMDPATTTESTIPRYQSVVSAVADKLRDQIIRGQIPDGAQPLQDEIATEYWVSRVKVREDLRQVVAGLTAAGVAFPARNLFGERECLPRFAPNFDLTFRVRSKAGSLPPQEAVVCRGEDVRYARLSRHTSWRSGKLQIGCGMEPCQGRLRGSETEFLLKWAPESKRPPIFPVRVEYLYSQQAGRSRGHHG
jgi:hypothetical protein